MRPSSNREPPAPTPAGEHPAGGSPGGEHSPTGGHATTVPAGIEERAKPGVAPPPGANQGKPEPVPVLNDPDSGAGAGLSGRMDRRQGTMSAGNPQAPGNVGLPARSEPDAAPRAHLGEDPKAPDTNIASRRWPMAAPDAGHRPVPSPGQAAAGVSVPSTQTAPGSSEESPETHDAKTAAAARERGQGTPERPTIAPRPSAPDGEVAPT